MSKAYGDKSAQSPADADADIASVMAQSDAMPMKPGQDNFEVFHSGEGDVEFRTVGWIQTSMIFLKIMFAVGVLSIPSAMNALGAFPGAINVLGFMAINTYCGVVFGNFRNRHSGCHSLADMANVAGGPILKEITNLAFLITYCITAASGMVGASVGMNTLSGHPFCTNIFLVIAMLAIAIMASVRKFEKMAWVAWLGFASVFIAVFIVVVGVTIPDRPATAPQSGPYDLGYQVIGHPTFELGITSAVNIFMAGTGTVAFQPVQAEMRRPQDYNKALFVCMGIVTASYLTFSLVVYRYCGQWVASPSLGSAGPTVKMIAYGVGMIGLLISSCLYIHICAKLVFVRLLRNSEHLQKNSFKHWSIWLSCTFSLAIFSYILASAIPIFNYLLALAGSLTFSPLALGLPMFLWMYDHSHYLRGSIMKKMFYAMHVFLFSLSAFMFVGGTYAVVKQIIKAYHSGEILSAFSCADNSGF